MNEPPLLETLQLNRVSLLRFLRARLGDHDRADDVFQSLSEQVLTQPATAVLHNPRSYLFRMAANAANSHLRSQKTRDRYETAAAHHIAQADERNPERVILGQDALKAAQAALDDLPPLTRRMFILFRVHGLPQKQIAQRFGVSLSTVEKRIAKAAHHCHDRLAAEGYEELTAEPRHKDKRSANRGHRDDQP
ncbi:MAG: RNA polymerase sigma factor [Pseudomonadota bacterium]